MIILGASGQLGSSLSSYFHTTEDIVSVSRSSNVKADICNSKELERVFMTYDDNVVINCVAYHDVGLCEKSPLIAEQINADALITLSLLCEEYSRKLVHISTDYVFDGDTTEPYKDTDGPNPINVYGKTKLEGEQNIQDLLNDYLIIRVSSLYSQYSSTEKGPNFVQKVIANIDKKISMNMVSDVIMSPTYCYDVARAIHKLLSSNSSGIKHIVNSGYCSWYDFAIHINDYYNDITGQSIDITPVSQTSFAPPYKTPRFTALQPSITVPRWDKSLKSFIYDRYKD